VVTNSFGSEVEYTDYQPFGQQREHTGTSVTDYKFTDQEYDASSGLYNYDARLYDPVIGRFVTPDSIVEDLFAPQTLNRYSYVRNNPLKYTDPTGNFSHHRHLGLLKYKKVEAPKVVEYSEGVYTELETGDLVGEKGLEPPDIAPDDIILGGAIVKGVVTGGSKLIGKGVVKGADDVLLKAPKKPSIKWDQNSQSWRDSATGQYAKGPKMPEGFGKPSTWKEGTKDVSNETIATKKGQEVYEKMRDSSTQEDFAGAVEHTLKESLKNKK
jgi:RHS repeat-associated protein